MNSTISFIFDYFVKLNENAHKRSYVFVEKSLRDDIDIAVMLIGVGHTKTIHKILKDNFLLNWIMKFFD